MQLQHMVTGANKTLADDVDPQPYLKAGWQVVLPPRGTGDRAAAAEVRATAESTADQPSAQQAAPAQKTAKKSSKKADSASSSTARMQAEAETGHAGLQVDEGASNAPTGDDAR